MKSLVYTSLEQAINQYIHLDPDVEKLLTPLAGRIVAIEVAGFNLVFYFLFTSKNVQILNNAPPAEDARISAPPLAFLTVAMTQVEESVVLSGKMKITGNTEVAQRASDLFNKLDIDWEEHLSRYTGDTIAHCLGNAFRNARAWVKTTGNTVSDNFSELLQEELSLLPPKEETDDFMNDVDKIREDCERLAARVQRLISKEPKA